MKKIASYLTACLMIISTSVEAQNQRSSNKKALVSTHPQPAAQLRLADFSYVAEQTIDAVVHIKCKVTELTPMYETFFGFTIQKGMKQQNYTSAGSGVIISSDGYIITNNHVVQDAKKITVTLNDRRVLNAVLIGNDPSTDLALIKVDATGLRTIPYGDSDATRVGEPVLAIGNPLNLTSTVTAGIISAKARNINAVNAPGLPESTIESFLQTDAAVNVGNSGGALVNGQGRLIGIVTAIASGDGYYSGYSFAIPSKLARKVAQDLKMYGYVQRAYLGVNVSSDRIGVVIRDVFPNCAADRAGLQVGDIIRNIAGTKITTYSEMSEELGMYSPGDEVTVTYERNHQLYKVVATLRNHKGTREMLTRQMVELERQR